MKIRHERVLVKTVTGGRANTQVWEDATPLALGRPFRCVLERTEHGIRLRDFKGSLFRVSNEELQRGTRLDISPATAIFLRPARELTASYIPHSSDSRQQLPLFAYAGIRRSLISCKEIHSAYVAYERGKPAFAFYHEADGARIKTLGNGVRLKFKGAPPRIGAVGEVWKLSAEQLATATLFKGWYWWRFNRVEIPAVSPGSSNSKDENRLFKTLSVGVLVGMAGLWGSLQYFVPAPVAQPEKPAETVVVHNKVRIYTKPQVKSDSPVGPSAQAAAIAPVEKEKMDAPKMKDAPKIKVKEPKAKEHAQTKKAPAVAHRNAFLNNLKHALTALKAPTQTSQLAAAAPETSTPELFTGSVGSVGQTAVAPLASGNGVQVQGFGGKTAGGYAQANVISGGAGTGGKGSFVSLETSGSHVDEGLTKDEVGEVIHRHMGEVRYCHQAAMLANPDVTGKLMVAFQINAQGIVTTADAESSTLNSALLSNCVIERLKTWHFPKPRGGVNVSVSYPFLFRVLETGQ